MVVKMINDSTYLNMKSICKSFNNTIVLDNVDFNVKRGEVHALLGENGAGKSTLVKILAGIYSADSGKVIIDGENVKINDSGDAQKLGISFIHQEFCLATNMMVYENVFMGRENEKQKSIFVNKNQMKKKTSELLNYLGVDFSESDYLYKLSIANKQMVEIAKALSLGTGTIIMDEPTSPLSTKEVDTLFKVIRDLQKKDISVIYISHRLEELHEIADRVTVLRDGKYISTHNIAEVTKEELITDMVGRKLEEFYFKEDNVRDETVLEVKGLSVKDKVNNVSFCLKKGEILGVSGLVGAGRSEIVRALFGIDKKTKGSIIINGEECTIKSPQDAFKHGLLLVPEDRRVEGLTLDNSVSFNITISCLKNIFRGLSFKSKKEKDIVKNSIKELNIKTSGDDKLVRFLSGGNQQKVVIAKILNVPTKILMLDEPTRGIDVGAKSEIYSIMNRLTKKGIAIIMISSELPEIVNMSDRVLVVSRGKITADLQREEIGQEKIMYYATGGK